MKKKSVAKNQKVKKQCLFDEKKRLKAQMQKYFIKPGTVDTKNP